ncbi:CRISPR-associated protein Csx3 [Nostoc sp. ATCC 53789]|uniref:CRISPR-associated protein Csx3 n=1 Tax=Nostoc sp. ATCC 53789 TaxID=76335 RepID=UPI000DED272E|nr:CRISPR-associated protein Csx3 [Nostoc sp. ATCC 53789]QHG20240.1 CRISPR-associated protein Csx3 [Nostoc sp. ATCC 53789]RCJ28718.1 CRISPR-associated protein Csx3 [Nostoc sp. ATCC 53789]
MTTYHIRLEGDVLKVGFGKDANGDQLVRDAAARLDEMVALGELSGGKLLKIDGPASVAVSYVIAHKISQLYGAIAVFDPKIGRPGYKTFITAVSQTPAYKIGELIETDEPHKPHKTKSVLKVALCGPPQSGKSCLREGLKQAISLIEGAPYPYVITACPDGEGAWFSDAARRDPDLARKLKDEYKAKFTPEFAQKAAGWVRSANTPLNIIDVGGRITDENRVIVREATHAVILASDRGKAEVPLWKEFCRDLNIQIIANLHSDCEGKEDEIVTQSPLLTGSVHYLVRGEDVSSRPMVQALARLLVGLCGKG